MVIIASIIGGFADIGWEVLSTLRRPDRPQPAGGRRDHAAGHLMDHQPRLQRAGRRPSRRRDRSGSTTPMTRPLPRACSPLARFPGPADIPEWVVYRPPINDAVTYISSIGTTARRGQTHLFVYLLPLRIGLLNSVRANYWGFDMSPT
jgi:glycine betaine/proline transport system permease protein